MSSSSSSSSSFQDDLKDKMYEAIQENDVAKLQEIVNNGDSLNIIIDEETGDTPLHMSIFKNKQECFNFLLNNKDTNIDARNYQQETPLHYAIDLQERSYILSLLKKGANVNLANHKHATPLNLTKNVFIAHKLILKGANVNHVSKKETPISSAIMNQKFNQKLFDCLLFYGGDVTVPDKWGYLPFFVNPHPEIEEMLFDLTFDSLEHYEVRLQDFIQLIIKESPFFYRLLDLCSDVEYSLFNWNWEHFDDDQQIMMMQSLLDKFKHIASKLMCGCNPLHRQPENLVEIVFALDESYASKAMFKNFIERPEDLDILLTRYDSMEFVLYLFSKGLQVTSEVMDKIYEQQGFSELFEILLHMEIIPSVTAKSHTYPRLIYDPNYYSVLINNTNESMLVKFFHQSDGVPSLIELSREVVRRHLVSLHGIRSSGMLISVLRCLPIPKILKDVLCYKRSLYR